MQERPNTLSSLFGFRMMEVALFWDLTKAYQSIAIGEIKRKVLGTVWSWGGTGAKWEIYGYNVVTFGDQLAGLVSELVKGLAADLEESLDAEASYQIWRKTYVNDGAGGGSP